MGKVTVGLLSVAGLWLVVGCQDKVAQERDKMYQENRELHARLDEAEKTHNDATPARAVESPAVAPAPPTQPAALVAPPPLPPAPVAPAPVVRKPDLGGLETSEDVAAGTTTVRLPSDIFFDSGRATLKDAAKAPLDKVVAALKKEYNGKKVEIDGHTDSDPIKQSKWKSNQELSDARAKAVKDYLVKQGISATRITTVGLGDTKPRGNVKALNRRVEVVVTTR